MVMRRHTHSSKASRSRIRTCSRAAFTEARACARAVSAALSLASASDTFARAAEIVGSLGKLPLDDELEDERRREKNPPLLPFAELLKESSGEGERRREKNPPRLSFVAGEVE